MKNIIPSLLVLAFTVLFQNAFAQDTNTGVANRLVKLINAADYSGVHNLFNKKMSEALPLEKATEFFRGLNTRFGNIQKLGEPARNAGWIIFPAYCERGMLDMSLALDDQNKIAGLKFEPRKPTITEVANRLVELINEADYPGVHKLFNKEMSEALPLKQATDFFTELTAEVGKIQKLGEPTPNSGWTTFPARCERGMMDLSLALDDQSKIAGVKFTPSKG